MTDILDGICVFASLYDDNHCSIKDDILGCNGKVEKCPILEEREQEMDRFFLELDGINEEEGN